MLASTNASASHWGHGWWEIDPFPRAPANSSAICGVGIEQNEELLHGLPGTLISPREEVGELHHASDSRVETQGLRILGDLLDRRMKHAFLISVTRFIAHCRSEYEFIRFWLHYHPPNPVKKVPHPTNTSHRPRLGSLQWPHEHFVQSQ